MSTWHKLRLREATEEEKEFYDTDHIWDGNMPEVDEQVLITRSWLYGVDLDRWIEVENGFAFEFEEVELGDTIYWASIPKFDLESWR